MGLMESVRIEDLARRVREVYGRAVRDLGVDLGGHSVLDLMADNFPTESLRTLEDVIVVAGIPRTKK